MKPFDNKFITEYKELTKHREPNFDNFLKVLKKEKPDRFTLFEFFLNGELYAKLADDFNPPKNTLENNILLMKAFKNAGYDYCTLSASGFHYRTNANNHGKSSRSMNESSIHDRESFSEYVWNEPEDFDTGALVEMKNYLPDGMKALVCGPGGILENVVWIVGYEPLCYMIADDPDLVEEIFENVGSRMLRYYASVVNLDHVGALISNDDWGFNTQTMLSVDDMRKYVFKWHKKITDLIHSAGKMVLLHSCGNAAEVYDDIIDVLKYDGKHSYEDIIQPVEEAYDMLNPRIAIMGGIDLDYVCRKTPEEVYNRSCAMLERSRDRGGFALGSGNSIPYYVPYDNYIAMIAAATMN